MTLPDLPQNEDDRAHPRAPSDIATLHMVVGRMNDQRLSREAVLREKLKASTVPLPPDLFEEVVQISSLHIDEVMTDHPGRAVWVRYSSYLVSAQVFDRAFKDLFSAIARFEEAVGRDIFDRRNELELADIESDVQKELFAATSAAHSLVDHSRRLQKVVELADYSTKRADCFGTDDLHDFVIALRTLLHHLQAIEVRWNVRNSREFGEEAGLMLHKSELQSALNQSEASFSAEQRQRLRAFMANAPDRIDLRSVFEKYKRRSEAFRSWFNAQLLSDDVAVLRDYQRCIAENRKRSIRQMWNALICNWLNWAEPPCLYNHLPRFLTEQQIAELYAMPMRSREQVDRLIELVDREGACDAALRERVHLLFQRVAPPKL